MLKRKIVNLKVTKAKIDTIPINKINFNKKKPEEFKVENNPTTMFDLKGSEQASQVHDMVSQDRKNADELQDKEMPEEIHADNKIEAVLLSDSKNSVSQQKAES